MATVSLAEPRRRQKWTLNPRGNLWANDENKFGHKLMEKMGWEKGKGLGAKQDGMISHVKIKQKDNQKGVGFEGSDDTWLAHQDDFQAVLAALNVEHGAAGEGLTEGEKKASLEAISRKSRRRVHYQKFVKGKDSSNYSADDLGCILGTKSEKVGSKAKAVEDEAKEEAKAENGKEENVKFKQAQGSYQDYFAAKMAKLKAKGKFTDVPTWTDSQASPRTLGLGAGGTDRVVDREIERESLLQPAYLRDALEEEKRKAANLEEIEEIHDVPEGQIPEGNPEELQKKKKKKDKSTKNDEQVEISVAENQEESRTEKRKKKKRCREEVEETVDKDSVDTSSIIDSKEEKIEEQMQLNVTEDQDESRTEKKKKKKRCKEEVEETEEKDSVDTSSIIDSAEEKLKKKKRKKSKKEKIFDEISETAADSGCEENVAKTKKAKKSKKEKNKNAEIVDDATSLAHVNETVPDTTAQKRKAEEDVSEAPVIKKKKSKKSFKNDAEASELPSAFDGFKGSNILAIEGYGVTK